MPLKLLLADRKLGAASKLAFMQLWDFAGRAPGRVVITADWLGGVCGRSPKAAWLWLNELEAHDLVKLGERNERRGTVVVDLYNPCPGGRCESASGENQTRLPIGSGENTPAIVAEVSTPKPPTPLVPKKVQELSCQSTKEFKAPTNSSDSMRALMAEATANFPATDAETKERLKRRIVAACGSTTPVAEWVAGSAANLVVYHGVQLPSRPLSLASWAGRY